MDANYLKNLDENELFILGDIAMAEAIRREHEFADKVQEFTDLVRNQLDIEAFSQAIEQEQERQNNSDASLIAVHEGEQGEGSPPPKNQSGKFRRYACELVRLIQIDAPAIALRNGVSLVVKYQPKP